MRHADDRAARLREDRSPAYPVYGPLRWHAVVALLAACLVTAAAPGWGALSPATTQLYPVRTRTVCHLPRSGNAQQIVGYDTGFSYVRGGVAYWSFGDSLGDMGSGVYGDEVGDAFRTGTLGRTTDLKARDCIDVGLATSTGSDVRPIPAEAGDQLRWPGAAFEANGSLYFFFDLLRSDGWGVGLGGISAPARSDLGLVRAPGRQWGPGESAYRGAINVDGRVYLLSHDTGQLRMARVPEAQITDVGAYEYFDGSGWSGDESVAAPILGDVENAPNVAYLPAIDRYVIVYTCSFGAGVCASTSKRNGRGEDAMWKDGWNPPTVIFWSAFAGHGFWHAGYADPAHPERIYVTTSRQPDFGDYWVTLYEIDLDDQLAPSSVVSVSAYQDVDFRTMQDVRGWSYASYVRGETSTTLTNLTTVEPVDLTEKRTYPVWVGDELADGPTVPGIVNAPGAAPRSIFPSPTRAGAKVYSVPVAGIAEVSGEAWLERTCGDGAIAEVLVLHGGISRTVWRKKLVAKWSRQRSRRVFDVKNIPVQTGDRIVFGVGNQPGRTARCDLAYFLTSVVVQPGGS